MDAVALEVATTVAAIRALAVDQTKIVENNIEIAIVLMTTKKEDSMAIESIRVPVVVVR